MSFKEQHSAYIDLLGGGASEETLKMFVLKNGFYSTWDYFMECRGRNLDGSRVYIDSIVRPCFELPKQRQIGFGAEFKTGLSIKDAGAAVAQSVIYRLVDWEGHGRMPVIALCPDPFDPLVMDEPKLSPMHKALGEVCRRFDIGGIRSDPKLGFYLRLRKGKLWTQAKGFTDLGLKKLERRRQDGTTGISRRGVDVVERSRDSDFGSGVEGTTDAG